MQLKKRMRNGCKIHVVCVTNCLVNENTTHVQDHPVLSKFMDVLPEEIPGLPPQREIDFSIEIVPGSAPVSKIPYRMSIPELTELKIRLQRAAREGLHHTQCVSLGSTSFIC